MLGRLAGWMIVVTTLWGMGSCAPPPVIPRCQGFEALTCETRMLCVVVSDGCQECVCERRWTDEARDPTPPGAPAADAGGGEGEGESDSEDSEDSEDLEDSEDSEDSEDGSDRGEETSEE